MTYPFMPPIESSPSHRNDSLKIIALLTMLIDHIGAVFFPDQLLWRTIGRIAFPIFSWQLVEGYLHTSNRFKYALRIFLFGCVSQIPYMFLNSDITMKPLHINIMFQLFSGILLLAALSQASKQWIGIKENFFPAFILSFFWFAVSIILVLLPDLVHVWIPDFLFSYGTYGQLMFIIFYLFRRQPFHLALAYCLLSLFHTVETIGMWDADNVGGFAGMKIFTEYWSDPVSLTTALFWSLQSLPTMDSIYFQARSIIALPFIWIFENRPGRLRLNRWIAYWFYPVHMAVLVFVKWMMMNG